MKPEIQSIRDRGLKSLKGHYLKEQKKHLDHQKRYELFCQWLDTNFIKLNDFVKPGETIGAVGSVVKHEGFECLLVEIDFRSAPVFQSSITLVPMDSGNDIGGGCGNRVKLEF